MTVSGYVLAGGRSSRMGRDKASLALADRPLAERAWERMRMVASHVSFCGAPSQAPALGPVLDDPIAGAGPLAGLVAALEDASRHGKDTAAVVMAVDLPLVPWELLQWLVSRATVSNAQATIPLVGGRPQPLCAVYRPALAEGLRQQLVAGERKVMRAVEAACSTPRDLDLFDLWDVMPQRSERLHRWFLNVNTPEDAALAEQALNEPRVW